ncbi:Uncharacterised protein [Serratia quinivorans]|nr:Uncharacterised protein [Serratia quinivorans]
MVEILCYFSGMSQNICNTIQILNFNSSHHCLRISCINQVSSHHKSAHGNDLGYPGMLA